jgi:ABC-type glycerol-3-phosphate transport system permease component
VSGIGAGLVTLVMNGLVWKGMAMVPVVGASGAIYGLLLALCAMVMIPFLWMLSGSVKTAAEITGDPVGTLRSRVFHALKKLREILKERP